MNTKHCIVVICYMNIPLKLKRRKYSIFTLHRYVNVRTVRYGMYV